MLISVFLCFCSTFNKLNNFKWTQCTTATLQRNEKRYGYNKFWNWETARTHTHTHIYTQTVSRLMDKNKQKKKNKTSKSFLVSKVLYVDRSFDMIFILHLFCFSFPFFHFAIFLIRTHPVESYIYTEPMFACSSNLLCLRWDQMEDFLGCEMIGQ